jgi:tRNA(Ser,Leu) C12 N-acetylase TAN1
MKLGPIKDLAAARVIEASLREALQKHDPERAIGLAGCLLLAARIIAVTASTKAELDDLLALATNLLSTQSKEHFATRERVAKRGSRKATQH